MPQIQNELAEKELIKKFRHDNSWMSDLTPKNQWVGNDVIKIPRQGADPTVLINNAVYPIVTNNHADDFIVAALNKYDTTNESVTADELYALPYDKVGSTQEKHRLTLEESTAMHALHSIAVAADSVNTPVLETTGPDDGTGRKRLITKDLIDLWKKLGTLKVPLAGRVLVLSQEHAADLMIEDADRAKSWGSEWTEGKVPASHVGFRLWVVSISPRYEQDPTDNNIWKKQPYAAVNGNEASICFFKPNAIKATGSVERFARAAKDDPENRQNTIGFRLYFGAYCMKDEGFAAIVSA